MPQYVQKMLSDKASKLVGTFFMAFVLLNFPIISIFGKNIFVRGIPLLYLYVFLVWLLIIVLLIVILRQKK